MFILNNDFQKNSRSLYRAKRRKTNLILNSLIVIVLTLIIIVAYNIFATGNDEKATTQEASPKTEHKTATNNKEKKEETEEKKDEKVEESSKEEDANLEEEQEEEASASEQADESQAVITEGGSNSNVIRTIVNPSWKPVGTTQTGEHTVVYDKSSVDWQEMLNAISYATGLDQSNMTVYWLGRDRTTANSSIGTVASKDKSLKYKVYITWVDNEGWMPTKVEEIAEIQR